MPVLVVFKFDGVNPVVIGNSVTFGQVGSEAAVLTGLEKRAKQKAADRFVNIRLGAEGMKALRLTDNPLPVSRVGKEGSNCQ